MQVQQAECFYAAVMTVSQYFCEWVGVTDVLCDRMKQASVSLLPSSGEGKNCMLQYIAWVNLVIKRIKLYDQIYSANIDLCMNLAAAVQISVDHMFSFFL